MQRGQCAMVPAPSTRRNASDNLGRRDRKTGNKNMDTRDGRNLPRFAGLGILAVAASAFAIGALAIGALAIGRLKISKARIGDLEVGNLTVHNLRVIDAEPGKNSEHQ
jgi:hypothetical protein